MKLQICKKCKILKMQLFLEKCLWHIPIFPQKTFPWLPYLLLLYLKSLLDFVEGKRTELPNWNEAVPNDSNFPASGQSPTSFLSYLSLISLLPTQTGYSEIILARYRHFLASLGAENLCISPSYTQINIICIFLLVRSACMPRQWFLAIPTTEYRRLFGDVFVVGCVQDCLWAWALNVTHLTFLILKWV